MVEGEIKQDLLVAGCCGPGLRVAHYFYHNFFSYTITLIDSGARKCSLAMCQEMERKRWILVSTSTASPKLKGQLQFAMNIEGRVEWERGNEECYSQRGHIVEDPEVREHGMWELKGVQWG